MPIQQKFSGQKICKNHLNIAHMIDFKNSLFCQSIFLQIQRAKPKNLKTHIRHPSGHTFFYCIYKNMVVGTSPGTRQRKHKRVMITKGLVITYFLF